MSKWVIRNSLGRYLVGWEFINGICAVHWSTTLASGVMHRSRESAVALLDRFRREVPDGFDLTIAVNQLWILSEQKAKTSQIVQDPKPPISDDD